MIRILLPLALLAPFAVPVAAHAQEAEKPKKEPLRVRVGLGAQIVPKYPGAGDTGISPYPDFAITRGDEEFPYESPDEAFGFTVVRAGKVEFGPAITFQGKRRLGDMPVAMDEVGFSLETGAFVQLWVTPNMRLRTEGRYGVSGHRGVVGSVGADYVMRDGDKYVFSIGPRINLSDKKYQTAYYGVNPGESARTGLPVHRPKGGAHSVGAIAGATYSLGGRWGLVGYARYDRLMGDAADSPFVRTYGSRDQFSAGAGLSFTFGRMR